MGTLNLMSLAERLVPDEVEVLFRRVAPPLRRYVCKAVAGVEPVTGRSWPQSCS